MRKYRFSNEITQTSSYKVIKPVMNIKRKMQKQQKKKQLSARKSEKAMIAGILEGSPDGIGVAVVRLDCGCCKMAAIDKEGEPASKVVIFRNEAESICEKCKDDNGAFIRVKEEFIHWVEPEPDEEQKKSILAKVFGSHTTH